MVSVDKYAASVSSSFLYQIYPELDRNSKLDGVKAPMMRAPFSALLSDGDNMFNAYISRME